MKTNVLFLIIGLFVGTFTAVQAQTDDTLKFVANELYKVTKNDASFYIGYILKVDEREVLLRTEKLGDLYIPKHEIKKIERYDPLAEKARLDDLERNLIASRYIQTTNGFPVRRGEGYLKIMPVGVDFQFAITDHWSMGGMTSWIGIPLVFTTKYSVNVSEKVNLSAGLLYGNLFYGSDFDSGSGRPFSTGAGILFGNVTFGKETANINFSGGYGFTHVYQNYYEPTGEIDMYGNLIYADRYDMEYDGTALFSVAAVKKVSKQVTLIFDSVINFNEYSDLFIFAPAIRYQPKQTNIFQFGLAMAVIDQEFLPIPIPMLSYHKVFLKY